LGFAVFAKAARYRDRDVLARRTTVFEVEDAVLCRLHRAVLDTRGDIDLIKPM